MFYLKGSYDFITGDEIEMETKLQFTGRKDLSEGTCAFIENITDERVMIHWHDKNDPTKVVQTAELTYPVFINTAHPVTLINLGDKSAVIKYTDLNTVIDHYRRESTY